ncbi:MAG TPA: Gfo/Idh/MocA family oxidoreductase [Candidatus Hydrogenedentes bacterium]|nr:Gfo/Idh/MocA family oxidoreductase [Candidatus Hydrogenedentota bacterium]HQM51022.1 Gfo/Idh/MocA family oxidoreductase [Candidatus Hydrogenedentota bacterium]
MSGQKHSLGVGLIGSGFMGHTYARAVSTLVEGAHLAGVATGSRAPDLATEYGVPFYDTYEALAASPDVDLVCVGTPHAQHAEHALAAIQAGKHVLIDKPMATTLEDCDAIAAEATARNLKCSVMFTQRNRVGVRAAIELITSGRVGRVMHIRTCQMVPNGMHAVPKWQMKPENAGLLLGHGIHNFDLLRVLTGSEFGSVFAKCRTMTGAPVEGTTDAIVTMKDGTIHYVFCSFELPKPGFPRSEFAARVICEEGLIDIDPYDETRVACGGRGWESLAKQPPIDWAGQGYLDPNRLQTYAATVQDLVNAVHEEREPRVTAWDGRQAVAAALAAYESSKLGRDVAVR